MMAYGTTKQRQQHTSLENIAAVATYIGITTCSLSNAYF